MKASVLFVSMLMIGNLALPCFARVPDYGPRRYAQVGRGHFAGHVVDRRGGPGWGGVAAAGIIGAIAGLALGSHVAPVPVYEPPVVGTVVPALPGGCLSVPTYGGGMVFNCGGIYYQPYYEGTELFYQVVPAP
ncbi:MAG TPA: hypothetical protein VME17_22430 [Bryobacteraceae bacterium]|nr:hypothetical protein [Bryobacteraceae bacterium]